MYYSHLTSFDAAIAHVRGHGEIDAPGVRHDAIYLLEEKRGNRDSCLCTLSDMYAARAIYIWFAQHDLPLFKQNAYVATKLNCMRISGGGRGMTLEGEYFYALFSDHGPLINWLMQHEPGTPGGVKIINNPSDAYFRHFQMTLALRGSWLRLAERAEYFLQAIPPKMKAYAADQRFYLALAQGNLEGMQEALLVLTSSKINKVRRNRLDFAFSDPFIGTLATMYAKIAWRHGYHIEIETPLIPKEWLPVAPLSHYEDPYPFMRAYDTSNLESGRDVTLKGAVVVDSTVG